MEDKKSTKAWFPLAVFGMGGLVAELDGSLDGAASGLP